MCPCKLNTSNRYKTGVVSSPIVSLSSFASNGFHDNTGGGCIRNQTFNVLSSSRVRFDQHVLDFKIFSLFIKPVGWSCTFRMKSYLKHTERKWNVVQNGSSFIHLSIGCHSSLFDLYLVEDIVRKTDRFHLAQLLKRKCFFLGCVLLSNVDLNI